MGLIHGKAINIVTNLTTQLNSYQLSNMTWLLSFLSDTTPFLLDLNNE